MKLTIAFSLVQCTCGAERQAGRSCPDCGREPEEVDPDLERRCAIAQGVSVRGPIEDVEPLALDEAFTALRTWFDGFSAAYEATDEGSVDTAVGRLRHSLEELDALQVRAARARRLRPGHAVWAAIDAVISAFGDVRDTFLIAMTAPTVADAEAAAALGQAAIDEAAAALARLNALADAWERMNSTEVSDEHADLLAGAEAVAALSAAADVVALDREGAELFARIAGDEVAAPTGLGLGLKLLDFGVEASMDPTRFWKRPSRLRAACQPRGRTARLVA